MMVPSLGSGNYSARDAGRPWAPMRFWVLVEVIDGFGGGSALSATLSQLADAPSLFSCENSTPVMFSFDGLFYLPVQLGNLRFTLEGRPGAAPSLLVQSPPGGTGCAVTIRGLPVPPTGSRRYRLWPKPIGPSCVASPWSDRHQYPRHRRDEFQQPILPRCRRLKRSFLAGRLSIK